MDPIEPILPDRPTVLPVHRAERAARVHRDGRGDGGAQGEHRRRPREEDGAEVDVEGIDASTDAGADETEPSALLPSGAHRLDLIAGAEGDPPAHRIDLTA